MCADILESLFFSTLIDSTPGVLVAWDTFGREYGFDGAAAAHDGHGRRLSESLVEMCHLETPEQVAVRPRLSPTLISLGSYSYPCFVLWHFPQNIKAAILRFEEVVIEGGPIALPAAQSLLSQIDAGSSPSARGWTIVTSGTYLISLISPSPTHVYFVGYPANENLATNVYTPKALARTGIPVPAAGYVTADDVERGKPEPDPYLAGAARVGVDPKNCTSTSTCY
jgi:beta-phosphoglucomutase-like phosphatase (HAD superfamily)